MLNENSVLAKKSLGEVSVGLSENVYCCTIILHNINEGDLFVIKFQKFSTLNQQILKGQLLQP